ncbi:MAG: DNA mismatch repair endonuclease MutL [Sandaracinaceae bacterium]|nr:DNA mismatch repair endonuclease MutL [Sandaracinaceae bacterium]
MSQAEPRIRLLDDALIDQIAAGEVVERPASVVKELLENALDAGATSVTVTILEGGVDSIVVNDDGHGMGPADAALAIQRHATSKIRSFDDLTHIKTLGFRGEALPSIASVSRFELTTRRAEDVEGVRVRVHGGDVQPLQPMGCAPGTTISVRDLFYAVPARRKFLKARQTETSHVMDVCRRVALAHPELRLHVFSNERRVGEWLPAKDWFARAQANFGDETLQRIEGQRASLGVRAALGAPERARTGAKNLYLFVNGRPVRDASLARAVTFAYGSVIPPGRFPAGVLHVDLPAEEVDVNAHPQKSEVRFAAGSATYEAVTRVLAKELGTQAFGGPASRSSSGFWEGRLGGLGAAPTPPLSAGATPVPLRRGVARRCWAAACGPGGEARRQHVGSRRRPASRACSRQAPPSPRPAMPCSSRRRACSAACACWGKCARCSSCAKASTAWWCWTNTRPTSAWCSTA